MFKLSMKMDFKSIEKIAKGLSDIYKKAEADKLMEIVKSSSPILLDSVKSKVKVRTGKLKKSYKFKPVTKKDYKAYGEVGSNSPVSRWVEFGHQNVTHHGTRTALVKTSITKSGYRKAKVTNKAIHKFQPAQPHLRPAYEETKDKIQADIENKLKGHLGL